MHASVDFVAQILGVHRSRIEQWISRNQFLPKVMSTRGKKREWDEAEVIRLAAFVLLVDEVGVYPADAGRLTQTGVHGYMDDEAFLVCYKTAPIFGWGMDIVRKRDLGEFLASGCHIPKVLMEGDGERVLDHNRKQITGPAQVAAVVNLDLIEKHVSRCFQSLATSS